MNPARRSPTPGSLQTRRLDAIWRITTNPLLDEERFAPTVLTFAAAALKPPQPFAVVLHRVCGDELVTEEAVAEHLGADAKRFGEVGDAMLVTDAPQRRAIRSARTLSWEDTNDDWELAATPAVRERGIRALVVVPFTAAQMAYSLSFISAQPAETPFEPDDHAFAEIIADQLERRLQSKWQNVKIRTQLETVSLGRGTRQNVIPLHGSPYRRRTR